MIGEQVQTHWKAKVALYLFFEGGGAGCYLLALIADLSSGLLKPFAPAGYIVGLVSVMVGAFFLWLDLGKRWRIFWATRNLLTSWIARGVVLVTVFIIFGAGYVFCSTRLGWWPDQQYILRTAWGSLNGLLALLVLIYPTLLLKSCRPFKLWDNPMLLVFSVVVSFLTGIAILLVVAFAIAVASGMNDIILRSVHFGIAVCLGILHGQIVAGGIYLLSVYASRRVYSSYPVYSPGSMSPYLITVFGVCWILPAILAPVALFSSSAVIVVWFSPVIAALLLAGSFLTRYLLLSVATRDYPFLPGLL